MFAPVLITAPTTQPVTVEEVADHLRLDAEDEDVWVENAIAAATSYLDGWTGILGYCLEIQTWRQDYADFFGCLRLPLYPVISVSSVTYRDVNDVAQTVATSNYQSLGDDRSAYVAFDQAFIYPTTTIETGPKVSITYVAGHMPVNNISTAPMAVKQAILLLVGHWYANRETVNVGNITTELEFTTSVLIAPNRRVRF